MAQAYRTVPRKRQENTTPSHPGHLHASQGVNCYFSWGSKVTMMRKGNTLASQEPIDKKNGKIENITLCVCGAVVIVLYR